MPGYNAFVGRDVQNEKISAADQTDAPTGARASLKQNQRRTGVVADNLAAQAKNLNFGSSFSDATVKRIDGKPAPRAGQGLIRRRRKGRTGLSRQTTAVFRIF